MKQGFEDAFMDLQSEYISLCMEVCGDLADEIDVLIYQDRICCAFNAFFWLSVLISKIQDIG